MQPQYDHSTLVMNAEVLEMDMVSTSDNGTHGILSHYAFGFFRVGVEQVGLQWLCMLSCPKALAWNLK